MVTASSAHNELTHGKNSNFGTTHCLPQRIKSMFFKKNNFEQRCHEGAPALCEKKFQKTLILVFEVPNRATTPITHFSNYTFFRVLAHCVLLMLPF